jgi:hypothetical protein
MNTLAGVAIDSVNYLIEEQRSLNGNSRFSLLLFNNRVETIRDAVPLSEFPLLDESRYRPCGGTALNDAVAGLIKSIGAHAQGRRSSVLCVIITDGMENVSRCYRIEDVRQMVTYRRLTHGCFWGLNRRSITPSQSESLEAISPALRPPQKGSGRFLIDSAEPSKPTPWEIGSSL